MKKVSLSQQLFLRILFLSIVFMLGAHAVKAGTSGHHPVGESPFGGNAWTIPGQIEAENFDLGGEGVAYHDTDPTNDGGQYRLSEAVDIEGCGDTTGGYDVNFIAAGEWLNYTVNVTTAGTYTLQARIATPNAGETFYIEIDGVNVTGNITTTNTGGWGTWQTISVTTSSITAGQHIMTIMMGTGGFNLNYVKFNLLTPQFAPAVTSAGSAAGNVGSVFNYAVTGTNVPTQYGATGLPAGLTINTTTGLISGISVGAGTFNSTVSATNIVGTGSLPVTLTFGVSTTESPYGGTADTIPGTIQAENYDNGGEGIAYHDNDALNNGGQYRTSEGVDVETSGEGGYDVGFTNAGEWMQYTINAIDVGTYTFQARVASPNTGESFIVEIDGVNIDTVNVPNTGAWQTYQTVSVTTPSISGGQHIMRIFEVTGGFNMNYFTFNSLVTTPVVPSYQNTALSFDARANDLVSRMTLTEKISQLNTNNGAAIPRLGVATYTYWNEGLHGISRLSGFTTSFPQAIAMSATWDRTLEYNVASAISDEARVEYSEGNALGLTYFSPTINMARDPRWGRTEETFGEDPYLTSQMAVQFIQGMQGNDPKYFKTTATAKHFACYNIETNRFGISSTVDDRSIREYYSPAFKACVTVGKVYSVMASYNAINGVPNSCNRTILTNILRKEWGFGGYVVSDCDGVAGVSGSHQYVMTDVDATALCLRNGMDLNCGNTYTDNMATAVQQGLVSETDIDTAVKRIFKARFLLGEFDPPASVPYTSIPDSLLNCTANQNLALQAGREAIVLLKNNSATLPLNKSSITKVAVIGPNANILQLGDYSGTPKVSVTPYQGLANLYGVDLTMGKIQASNYNNESGIQVENSSEGTTDVCFIDNGDYTEYNNVNFGTGKTKFDIRVTSPYAGGSTVQLRLDNINGTLVGTYTVPNTGGWQNWVTVSNTINVSGVHNVYLIYGGGMNIEWLWPYNPSDTLANPNQAVQYTMGCTMTGAKVQANFDSATALAARCDVAIVFCGTDETVASESLDRTTIELPGVQEQLIEAVYAANPKTIVVLVSGCPLAITWEQQNIPAIIDAWYDGEAQGTAITDVLFGNYNPGGKLTTTWFPSTASLPNMNDYNVRDGRSYMYNTVTPIYSFGFGLSYTTFSYSNLRMSSTNIGPNGQVTVSADIKNTGSVAGDEIPQLYIHQAVSTLKLPAEELKGFQRVTIQPGQTQTVSFTFNYSDLDYYDTVSRTYKVDAGTFNIYVGASSSDIRLTGSVTATAGTAGTTYRQDATSNMEAEYFENKSLAEGTVVIDSCSEGGQMVAGLSDGTYLEYRNVDFGTGASQFNARIAAASSGGSIEVHLDSTTGALIGKLTVTPTGGWQTFTTQTCPVTNATSVHDVFLVFRTSSSLSCNINKFDFATSCTNSTTSFIGTSTTGNTYQWQLSTDSVHYNNISNSSLYSGVTADTLTLTDPPTSMYGDLYRCAITKAGVTTYSSINTLKFTATWTGAINTDWATAGNWSCDLVPDAHTDVIINTGLTNYPIINSSAVCRSITAEQNSSVQVNSSHALQVTGPQ
jgi:beta-glucosidase